MSLINCSECNKQVSSNAISCPNCGNPIKKEGVRIIEKVDTRIKCPKCGSKSVSVISNANKTASLVMWGPLAANNLLSNYKCMNCGHKFR